MDYNHLCLHSCVDLSIKYPKAVLLLWINYVISVLCVLCFLAHLFIDAFRSPAGKGLTSWLSFVMFYCEFVTFPLVSAGSGVVHDCVHS